MGVNWACTMFGFIGLVFLPCPFLFYKYGARLRAKSVFAPCIVRLSQKYPRFELFINCFAFQDLKIKKQIEEEERDREKGSKNDSDLRV
jgi:DHA1 family multidrug resistance protein-like MFS transporter